MRDFVLGNAALIPLAGPANKQGRMAADNICGRKRTYAGTQGTAILKVFDLTAAMTGASEKALSKTNIEYEKLYLHLANHAEEHTEHVNIETAKEDAKNLSKKALLFDF